MPTSAVKATVWVQKLAMSEDICGSKEGVGNSVSFNDLPVVVLAEASKTGLVLVVEEVALKTTCTGR